MTDTQSQFAALPPKQKIMAVIFFFIGAFILYEVIGMFRGGEKATVTPKLPPPTMASKGASAPSSAVQNVPPGQSAAAKNIPPSSPQPAQQQESSSQMSKPTAAAIPPPPTAYVIQQDQTQSGYLKALNELQILKLEREMAETNQAIMAAKLATVTAEKDISDLLSPESAESKTAAKQAATPSTGPTPGLPSAAMPSGGGSNNYVVQSVTMEQEQWHAVLNYKNIYYDVTVGDVLPPDGSVVTAIDQKGVTLQQGGVEQRFPLTMTNDLSGGGATHKNGSSWPGGQSTSLQPPPPP